MSNQPQQAIVCFASNYFFDPTSKHHVMREMSKRYHVLWINWHASRRPSLTKRDFLAIFQKLKQINRGIIEVTPHFWVLTPFVLPLPSSSLVRKINRWLVTLQCQWTLRKLPYSRQLWSFTPDVTDLLGSFREEFRLYYCVDEFSAFPGYDIETIQQLDRQMCQTADLVVTSSKKLFENKRPYNSNIIQIPHGVLYQQFAQALKTDFPEVEDIAHLPRPRVGFYGLIHEWQDLDLIARLARRRPHWSFIFIGSVQTDIERFKPIPNLHFPGQRPHEMLPAYCKSFDAALIPHKINNLTQNMNPIKLREYLAAGLPVVSSPLPEVRCYEPNVRIAQNDDEWITALEWAIADRCPQADYQRSLRVADEDWSVRVAEIVKTLEKIQQNGTTNYSMHQTLQSTEAR